MTPPLSWLDSANDPTCGFSLANLPYGVLATGEIVVAIGDRILNLKACFEAGLVAAACKEPALNTLMSLGRPSWLALRQRITELLTDRAYRPTVEPFLIPLTETAMTLPATIGDYTDFYASIHHATNVGKLFRPDNPLLPNYKHVPIGYHGRASSIVVSGTAIRRPQGQSKPATSDSPVFGPSGSLDYELEAGLFIGPGNKLGEPIPIDRAEDHIFGFCLLNDWSARDIQSWEYQPLGPFLGKSFATSISPWIVTLEALAPYRVPPGERPAGDPAPLPYLMASNAGIFDIQLEVFLTTSAMRDANLPPHRLSHANFRNLYWTPAQLVTHHASNGCNLRPGDLLASGTVSGPSGDSRGCLLEITGRGAAPIHLPTGESRKFLEDGDEIIFRGYCERDGLPRISFGECRGVVVG